MKKYIVIAVALLIGGATGVSAQTVAVDIARAKISWAWAPASNSGPLVDYEVRCGQVSKTYTKMTPVPLGQNTLDIKNAITGNGPWFCTVAARNQHGAVIGNEVPFLAGTGPIGVLSVTVLVQ